MNYTENGRLNNVIFRNELGKIDHLEDYYEIPDSNKKMLISESELRKNIFCCEVYYGVCSYWQPDDDSLNTVLLSPEGGATTAVIRFDYKNVIY